MQKLPSLPAVHLAGVQQAERESSVLAAGDRAAKEDAAAKSREAGGDGAPVRGVEGIRETAPSRDTRGARSHTIKKRKKGRKKKELPTLPAPVPPDPRGLGSSIDLKA